MTVELNNQINNYIIVVRGPVVERLLQSLQVYPTTAKQVYSALADTWISLIQKYPLPDYDLIAARGTLSTVRNVLAEYTGWEHILPETIELS